MSAPITCSRIPAPASPARSMRFPDHLSLDTITDAQGVRWMVSQCVRCDKTDRLRVPTSLTKFEAWGAKIAAKHAKCPEVEQ